MTAPQNGLPSERAPTCRRRRMARCIVPLREMNFAFGCMVGSDAEDHDFGGFDEGGGAFAGLEAHFAGGVGGDERSDMLFTDAERNLGEETVVFYSDDAADKLIAARDFAEGATAFRDVAAFERFGDEAVDFGFRDAVMAAGSFGGFEFAAVDPLLEGGVTDAEDDCGFARSEKSLHEFHLKCAR